LAKKQPVLVELPKKMPQNSVRLFGSSLKRGRNFMLFVPMLRDILKNGSCATVTAAGRRFNSKQQIYTSLLILFCNRRFDN